MPSAGARNSERWKIRRRSEASLLEPRIFGNLSNTFPTSRVQRGGENSPDMCRKSGSIPSLSRGCDCKLLDCR